MKGIKNTLSGIILTLFAVMLSACGSRSDTAVTSVEVKSITPKSFKNIEAIVEVGVHNPGASFALQDMVATIYYDATPLAVLTTDDVKIDKKCDKNILAEIRGTVCDNVSLVTIITLVQQWDNDQLKVDVSLTFRHWTGIKRKIEYKQLKVSELIKQYS